jgi:hypothetical protein
VNRTVKRAVVLLAAIGMACLPGTAIADTHGTAPIFVAGNGNQVAGGDNFNAGHSNIVGSGDGEAMDENPGGPIGAGTRMVQIQTGFDSVQLLSHTGDASFPARLPFKYRSDVSLTVTSTAVYRGMDTDYQLAISVDSSGQTSATCEPTSQSGRCDVRDFGDGPVVTMG